ncbi:MAG TPA: SEC-C domain-containing protein [Solirubrobacterales bacterium]|nr:SEC-C domain-containing protein [Solirubrobacterales bacterium]
MAEEGRGAEVKRTYPELLTKLRSQVGFLERSAAHFDAGHKDEGEQLATRARVLLHDARNPHSLLGQLGVKGALRFTDTAIYTQPETKHLGGNRYVATGTQHAGLVCWQSTDSGTWTYAPVLAPESKDRMNPPVGFEHWWRTPFLKDLNGESISRSSVVLHVADKDGGAHVDKALPKAFHRLLTGYALPFQVASDDGSSSDIPGIVMATTRQIAFELLDTLHRELPNFILGGPLQAAAELSKAERAGVRRNAPCPCESGKKFKVCHGT